jgi:hypothetical protein
VTRASIPLLVTVLVAACTTASGSNDLARRAQLDAILAKCGLPKDTLHIMSKDELRFNPSPDTSYEAVDCALTELRKTDLPMKLGFVGNAAPTKADKR